MTKPETMNPVSPPPGEAVRGGGSSQGMASRGSTGASGEATPCVVCFMPVPADAHSRVCSPECRDIEYGPRVSPESPPHLDSGSDWKVAAKALTDALADERDRTIAMTRLLVHARTYVADALDAHEHSDGRTLLTDIDALFAQQEHFPPCHNCGQDTVVRGPRGFVDCIVCNPPPGRV
jgi:hypothetical protein